jgi:signal transduction histidine kinase
MKSDFVFALETAAWPVLAITHSGVIWRANTAAAELFSAVTETGRLSAASIWSPDNESSVEVFLSRAHASAQEAVPVKLRTRSGQTAQFSAYVTTFNKDGQKHFLVQLLKPSPAPSQTPPVSPEERGTLEQSRRATPEIGDSNLAQKQKLECALQLARSVALDFNNALTSILGYTSLLLSRIEMDNPWRTALVEMEKSAEKAAEVAADLAAFSRQDKDAQLQVAGNLNDVVRRTVEIYRRAAPESISWASELEPRLYTVSFDEPKLQQAFNKILDNAVQALPEEGRIAVRTRNQDLERELEEGNMRLPAGSYVCIEFEDSGCGIEPDVLPRIFEPFFTTKQAGNHRGLGLAWVYGIVTNHGGRVAVSSQVGRGTTVRVFLPAQKKIVLDRALAANDLGGTETVLFVDDEDLLLTMGATVLSSFGYRVLTANSGRKALDLFQEHASEIDLVITDLVMPQMSGRELMQELRRISPTAKVICSSGYAGALNTDAEGTYLQKPFTSVDLLRTVKRALAETKAS